MEYRLWNRKSFPEIQSRIHYNEINWNWQRQYDANQDQFLILLVPSHVSLVWTGDRMGYFVSSCFVGTQLALSRSWFITWWRHQMETFSALLALCEGMMTSSNGNIFRVTSHMCGEFTCPRMRPNAFPKAVSTWLSSRNLLICSWNISIQLYILLNVIFTIPRKFCCSSKS